MALRTPEISSFARFVISGAREAPEFRWIDSKGRFMPDAYTPSAAAWVLLAMDACN
jgi:hypothetical protein